MEDKDFIIDNDVLEKLIKECIGNKLDEIDFTYEFKNVIREKLEKKAEEYIDKKIKEEIERVMEEPVHTDDGWGNKRDYETFEDLFKQTFSERMSRDWEIRRIIERTVEEKTDSLLKNKTKAVTEKLQDIILSEIIKDREEN